MGCNSVGAGNRLHQGVVTHGLVEVECREGGRIKAGEPHGANKNEAQRVLLILELPLEVVAMFIDGVHALFVKPNIQPLLDKAFFVMLFTDHYSHFGSPHKVDQFFEPRLLQLVTCFADAPQ